VVFSFDGDAAGRRAAARALEAALPHAGDMRDVRFLFLPTEHDPDSYVRELGATAFEQALAAAVPLSRQLLVQAADGCDLGHAEGRARMLAQARPLWDALPDGALKRQLLAELAHQGQLGTADLAALWGGAPAARRGGDAIAAPRPPVPRAAGRRGPGAWRGRNAPPGAADLALRLLLRHSAWWERLGTDDHQLLHDLGGVHGRAVAWLERQIVEHGPPTSADLAVAVTSAEEPGALSTADDDAATDAPLADAVTRWLQAADAAPHDRFEDLQRVLQRLWVARLADEAAVLAAQAERDPQAQVEYQDRMQRIKHLKAAMAEAPTEAPTTRPSV
jgi:DNA primase